MNLINADTQIFFILLGIFYFLISFFNIGLGLIIMAVAMLFSPEIPVGSFAVHSLVIRIEDVLIIVLGFAWIAHIAIQKGPSLFISSPLNIPILWVIGISIVSTFWGIVTGWLPNMVTPCFYILKEVEFFLIFFLVLNYVRTEQELRLFLFFTILTVSMIGIYTLTQVPSVKIFSSHRITAPFEGRPEPATVGGYMALFLLIIFSLLLYEEKTIMKWFYGLLGGVVLVPFIYTLNRSSYLALIGGIVFITVVEKRKWLTVLVILLFLTSPLWLPQSVKERIAFTWLDAANPGRELGVDQSFQERIYAFKTLWNNCKTSPLIGRGVASYLSDNQYVRTLHEMGIIGLSIWVWVFVRLFKISRWLFQSLERGVLKGMVLGYRAGLLGLLFHAFGAPTLYIVRIMEPFWFISGLVVSLYLIRANKTPVMAQ